MGWSIVLLPVIVPLIIALAGLRVVKEGERLAVLMLGRFSGLKGPGLTHHLPVLQVVVRLQRNMEGVAISESMGKFNGCYIPIAANNNLEKGARIRLVEFKENAVQVEALNEGE